MLWVDFPSFLWNYSWSKGKQSQQREEKEAEDWWSKESIPIQTSTFGHRFESEANSITKILSNQLTTVSWTAKWGQ